MSQPNNVDLTATKSFGKAVSLLYGLHRLSSPTEPWSHVVVATVLIPNPKMLTLEHRIVENRSGKSLSQGLCFEKL